MGLEINAIKLALAAAGIRDLKVAFKPADGALDVTGTRWNRPFSFTYDFTDIEQFINDAAAPSDAASPSQPGP